MCGDFVGAPRRAMPTVDTSVAPAHSHGPILRWTLAQRDEASPVLTADPWHTCRV